MTSPATSQKDDNTDYDGALEEEVANFMAFVGAEKPRPNSIFIAVIGMTGSGKSSFISACTGRIDVEIGHDLASCTNSVGIFHCLINGYNVYLIDTPGFDDTNCSDLETLKVISHYFSVSYANRIYLNGIIYLHRISDNRISGTSNRNISMLKALCGESAYSNIAVITNMWTTNENRAEYSRQEKREEQLKREYISEILNEGGILLRQKDFYQNIPAQKIAARNVLLQLIEKWKSDEVVLQIQYEMVDNSPMTLDQTAAGRALNTQMVADQKKYDSEIAKIHSELSSAIRYNNEEAAKIYREQKAEFQLLMDQTRERREEMKMSIFELHKKEADRFMNQLDLMEKRWKDELAEREREMIRREELFKDMHRQAEEAKRKQELAERKRELVRRQEPLNNMYRQVEERTHRDMALTTTPQGVISQSMRMEEQRHQAELAELRAQLEQLRYRTENRLETVQNVKRQWVGPLLQGLVTGSLGLAGTLITAGMMCIVQ